MTPAKVIIIMLATTLAATLFHVLILIGIIPYDITWGGRLKSVEEMYVFESLSIAINLFFVLLLLRKGDFVQRPFTIKTVNVWLWVFTVLFGLNTLGNLVAETNFERAFALVTGALCAGLVWVLRWARVARFFSTR